MKNAPFFFKTFICNQCFGKYRLRVLFCDDIGHCLCFLEHFLPTPPLGYCFLVFKYISVIHLCTIFAKQLWHKSNSVNSASVQIYLLGQTKIKHFALFGRSVSTLQALGPSDNQGTWVIEPIKTLGYSRHSGIQSTQGTWTLKAPRHLRHSSTWATETLYLAGSRVLHSHTF